MTHQEKTMTNLGLPPAQLANGLIISVGEARKILGADSNGRSDDEIAVIILELTQLGQELLNTSILLD